MPENKVELVSEVAHDVGLGDADVPTDHESPDGKIAGHLASIETASWAPASTTVSALLAVALTAPR